MHPVHTPLTVAGALLSRPDRDRLTDEQLQALAATFPSTAHLGHEPWCPEAVIEQARACWSGVCASVDPTFGELSEADFEPALPSSMQTLSTLRFLLWLWRPGIRKTDTGTFDLGLAYLCHWDAAHRAAFLRWAQDGLAGPTGPSERYRGGRAAHPHADWPDET